jgi:hypothetical protein
MTLKKYCPASLAHGLETASGEIPTPHRPPPLINHALKAASAAEPDATPSAPAANAQQNANNNPNMRYNTINMQFGALIRSKSLPLPVALPVAVQALQNAVHLFTANTHLAGIVSIARCYCRTSGG